MKQICINTMLLIFLTSCVTMQSFQDMNYGTGYGHRLVTEEDRIYLTKKFNLPPDPGKKGEETLFGIDADNDGLRDDVQRWIYLQFPDEPLMRKALRQEAVDAIETFKYVDDKEKSIESSRRLLKSIKCARDVWYLINSDLNYDPSLTIMKIIEDTYERYETARITSSNFSGQGYTLPEYLSTCRFKIDHPNLKHFK